MAGGDAPAITLLHLTNDVVVAADGSYIQTIHSEIRANNDAAAMQVAQKTVGYSSALQKLEVVEAYTLKKDGHKIPVEASAIYDQLPPGAPQLPMFTDERQKTIIFPQFAAGDTAVYTLKVSSQPYFPGKFSLLDAFPRSVAIEDARETITAPREMPLQVESDGVEFSRKTEGANIVYTWHYANPNPVDDDIVIVSPLERLPRFYATSLKDYAELGRLFAEGAAPKMAVTHGVRDLAAKITENTSDRREQAKNIYEWVSGHIRYVAEELGKGSLVPHDADTVIANGYGDCKDHVVLLAALLKARGIESKAILINAQNEYEVPKVATFAAFNHVISWLPEFDLYLDSNAVLAPFGVLPIEEYGKPMVVAVVDDARLGTMPLLPAGLMASSTKTVESLDKDGVLTGTTTTETEGPSSIVLRIVGLGIQKMGPETAGARLMVALGHKDATGRADAPPPLELTPGYTITGTFRSPDWKEEVAGTRNFYIPGGMRLLGLSGDGMMGPFTPGKLKDTEPVLCFNGRESEDISLTAPPGVHFTDVPKDLSVKTANIAFTAHWSLSNGTLNVSRAFVSTIDRPYCTAEIRKANTAALKQVADNYDTEISFTLDKAADASRQETKPNPNDEYYPDASQAQIDAYNAADDAEKNHDYKKQIKLLSDILPEQKGNEKFYGAVYRRRGYGYVNLGQAGAALEDANASLRLAPDNLIALRLRAMLYMQKSDVAHALPDVNRLIEAAPNDELYDMRGTIYVKLGQYDRAAADYSALLKTSPNNTMYLAMRGIAYEKTGHFDEAAADLTRIAAKDTNDLGTQTLLCEVLARSKTPNKAIPRCTLLLEYSPYLADVMNWRGYAYFRMGNYAKALHDFDGAARVYPNANEAVYLFERGIAKARSGDRAGGEQDMAAAKHMSSTVTRKVAALKMAP